MLSSTAICIACVGGDDIPGRICKNMTQAPVPLTRFQSNSKFDQNCSARVWNTLNQSQRDLAHVTTALLTWHVPIFQCDWPKILWARTLQNVLNSEFDRNIVSGTGARYQPVSIRWWMDPYAWLEFPKEFSIPRAHWLPYIKRKTRHGLR